MAGSGENAPLLGRGTPTSAGGESSYYFLNQGDLNHQGGTTEAVRDSDGGQVVEGIPHGSNADEFAPRVIGASSKKVCTSTSKHLSIGYSIFYMKLWSRMDSQEFAALANTRVTAYSLSYNICFVVSLLLNFIAKTRENRDVMVAIVEILET